MAITVPQSAGNASTGAGSTLVVTLGSNPGVGSLLVAAVSLWDAVTGISGGGVTTWSAISGMAFTADANHENSAWWWGVVDGTPGTAITITENGVANRWRGASVLELVGAQQATNTTVVPANDAVGATDSKTITPTVDGCCVISLMSKATTTNAGTIPTGYTDVTAQIVGSDIEHSAYLIQTTAGASSMNWTVLGATSNPSLSGIAVLPAVTGITKTFNPIPFMK